MSQYRERVESIYLIAIVLSIAGGLGASILRLPPLIGFLAAGFIMSALGLEQIPFIDYIAELGVTTLLFTIGLKLNPHDIARPRVVGTATAHAVVNTIVFAGLFALFAIVGWTGLLYIGIAASFSSTVFVCRSWKSIAAAARRWGVFPLVCWFCKTSLRWVFLWCLLVPPRSCGHCFCL